MSAGSFLATGKYEADNGDIYRIRVQPETVAANIGGVNAVPAAAVNQSSSARVGGGNRQIGVKARSVTVRFTATVPDGYAANQLYRVPILQKSIYDGVTSGATGTYLGVAVVVVGKNPERVR